MKIKVQYSQSDRVAYARSREALGMANLYANLLAGNCWWEDGYDLIGIASDGIEVQLPTNFAYFVSYATPETW